MAGATPRGRVQQLVVHDLYGVFRQYDADDRPRGTGQHSFRYSDTGQGGAMALRLGKGTNENWLLVIMDSRCGGAMNNN